MLNAEGNRELAYVVTIDEIRPIEGYDRVEHARVGGWWVIVRKDQFKVGDLAIYIEVDSKVPEKEPFMFLDKRNFKVKTLKMCKVISQGLLMSAEDFGWTVENQNDENIIFTGKAQHPGEEYFKVGDFFELSCNNCLLYCDPPYQSSHYIMYEEQGFDYKKYWDKIRELSKDNIVICSEYYAPNDFDVIYEKKLTTTFDNKNRKIDTEKLFVYKGETKS